MTVMVEATGHTGQAYKGMVDCRNNVQRNGNMAITEINWFLDPVNPTIKFQNQISSTNLDEFITQINMTIQRNCSYHKDWQIGMESLKTFQKVFYGIL